MAKRESAAKKCATGASCGCGVNAGAQIGPAGRPIGPGGHATGVDAAIKSANLTHLRRIEGQVRGIAAMIEDDRYCADIITQVSAARESLHSVARNLMRNHLRHCAARALRDPGPASDEMIEELLTLVGKVAR